MRYTEVKAVHARTGCYTVLPKNGSRKYPLTRFVNDM
jgi:hypothetical protein